MTIAREQVADLRKGDVVEIRESDHPDVVTRGALHEAPNGALDLGGIYRVRSADGQRRLAARCELTVVSRAPRPLYVNHDRTEPVPGDVVRADEFPAMKTTWRRIRDRWIDQHGVPSADSDMAFPKRLLVDGTTGQVVP